MAGPKEVGPGKTGVNNLGRDAGRVAGFMAREALSAVVLSTFRHRNRVLTEIRERGVDRLEDSSDWDNTARGRKGLSKIGRAVKRRALSEAESLRRIGEANLVASVKEGAKVGLRDGLEMVMTERVGRKVVELVKKASDKNPSQKDSLL